MAFKFLDEWARAAPAAAMGADTGAAAAGAGTGLAADGGASGLEAYRLAAEAGRAPDSLAELEELSRITGTPAGVWMQMPEEARRRQLARLMAKNSGLMRFARENAVNQAIAVARAEEAAAAAKAFSAYARIQAPDTGASGGDFAKGAGDGGPRPGVEAGEAALAGYTGTEAGESAATGHRGAGGLFGGGGFLDMTGLERAVDALESATEEALPELQDGEASRQALAGLAADSPALEEAGGDSGLMKRNASAPSGPADGAPAAHGAKTLAGAPSGLDYLTEPFKNFYNGWLDLSRGVVGAGKSVADLAAGQDSGLSRWFQNSLDFLAGAEAATHEPQSFPGRFARDVVRAAPQLIPQIGLHIYGGAAASMGFMFSHIYGNDYVRHTQMGVSPENAAFAGALDAAVQSSLERVGMSALLRTPGLSSLVSGAGKSRLAQYGAAGARGFFSEAATESAQYLPDYLTTWWAQSSLHAGGLDDRLAWTWRQASDARHILEGTGQAIYEGLVGGVLGGGASLGHYHLNRKKYEPEVRAWLDQLRDEAAASVRRLCLEDAMARARQSMSGIADEAQRLALARAAIDPAIRSACLTSQDLRAVLAAHPALSPESLESLLGAPAGAVSDALASGQALDVDIASLIASRAPLARQIGESLRLAPDGPALGEAKSFSPQVRLEEVSRVLNQEDDYADFPEEERASAAEAEARRLVSQTGRINREITRISRELRAAGMTALEAEANSSLLRAHALAWWKRYGLDGAAILERVAVEDARRADNQDGNNNQNGENQAENESGADNQAGNRNRPPRAQRGSVELSASRSLIRLFASRDPSTFSHEASHIFLQDLLELRNIGEDSVLSRLQDEIDELVGDDLDFVQRVTEELAEIRRQIEPNADRLRSWANALLEIAREREGVQKGLWREPAAADPKSQIQSDEYYLERGRAKSARRLARRARELARQIEALGQARADLDAFARHAGLNAEALAGALSASDLAADLSAPGLALARQSYTSLQERTAQAFLNYLSDGRAPSPALQPAFARFASWLADLWRRYQVARPDRTPPDLAAAFDRLLASDRDLRVQDETDALARGEIAFISETGLPKEEAARMRELLAVAQANSLGKARRSISRFEKKYRKSRMRELMDGLMEDPFWIAAERRVYNPSEMSALLGGERFKKFRLQYPKLFRENAPLLEETRHELGYADSESLAEELYARLIERGETRRSAAGEIVEAELAAKLKSIEDGASWLNPALGKYLDASDRAVARIAASLRLESDLEISRWVDNSRVPQVTIDAWAQQRVENTPLSQLTHNALMRALQAALTRRSRLIREGGAASLMRALSLAAEARVIYAMMELTAKARKSLESLEALAQKIARAPAGSFPAAHTEALRQLLKGYRLGTMRAPLDLAYARALPDLVAEIVADEDLSGSLPAFPRWLLSCLHPQSGGIAARGGVNLNSMTPAQIREVENLLKFLAGSGRAMTDAGRKARAARLENAAADCAAVMESLPDRPQGQGKISAFFSSLAQKGAAAVDILLWQARKGDGMSNIMGKGETGPLESLVREIFPAEERVKGWLDKVYRSMEPHLNQLLDAQKRLAALYGSQMDIRDANNNPVIPPEAWRKAYGKSRYTPEMIFAMALNLGNRSNAARLLGGYGPGAFSFEALEALFGTRVAAQALNNETWIPPSTPIRPGLLSRADWLAIQGVWDSLALLWPDTRLAHIKLHGFAPEQVSPFPLTIQGADGKTLTLAGGYYPAAYDGKISDRVGAWSEEEDILARNEARYQTPSARDGHTKSRSARTPGLPVLLDLSPISRHVMDSARFIELAGLVRDLDRVTSHKSFRDAYRRKFGLDDYAAIRPNLRGLLRTEKLPDIIAELERKVRKYLVPWGLSWNPNVAVLQSTAVFSGMGDLGARPMLSAMKSLLFNPSLRHDIWRASPYMVSRIQNLDQDLVRQTARLSPSRPAEISVGGKTWTYEDFVDLGMKGIVAVDAAATCAVWLAAYRSKLEELRENPPPEPPRPAPRRTPPPSPEDMTTPDSGAEDDIAAQVERALYGEPESRIEPGQNAPRNQDADAGIVEPELDAEIGQWLNELENENSPGLDYASPELTPEEEAWLAELERPDSGDIGDASASRPAPSENGESRNPGDSPNARSADPDFQNVADELLGNNERETEESAESAENYETSPADSAAAQTGGKALSVQEDESAENEDDLKPLSLEGLRRREIAHYLSGLVIRMERLQDSLYNNSASGAEWRRAAGLLAEISRLEKFLNARTTLSRDLFELAGKRQEKAARAETAPANAEKRPRPASPEKGSQNPDGSLDLNQPKTAPAESGPAQGDAIILNQDGESSDSRASDQSGPSSQNSGQTAANRDGAAPETSTSASGDNYAASETSGDPLNISDPETSTNPLNIKDAGSETSSSPLNPGAIPNPDASETPSENSGDSSTDTSTDASGGALPPPSLRSKILAGLGRAIFQLRARTGSAGLVDFDNAFHHEAARYADMIVKQSNPDFDPSSRSSFLRSRGMMRLLNQFSSAVTLYASRNAYMLAAMRKGKITRGQYARHLAYDYLFPAVFLFLLYGGLRDMWDREKKPGQSFAAFFMDQSSMAIPVFGGVAADLAKTSLGMGRGSFRCGDIRTSLDAPMELLAHNAGTLGSFAAGRPMSREQKKSAMYALGDLISFLLRVPVSKVIRRAERGCDQMKRGEGSPFSLLVPKAGK